MFKKILHIIEGIVTVLPDWIQYLLDLLKEAVS